MGNAHQNHSLLQVHDKAFIDEKLEKIKAEYAEPPPKGDFEISKRMSLFKILQGQKPFQGEKEFIRHKTRKERSIRRNVAKHLNVTAPSDMQSVISGISQSKFSRISRVIFI